MDRIIVSFNKRNLYFLIINLDKVTKYVNNLSVVYTHIRAFQICIFS